MIKDIAIGQFIPGNSILHKLDARTKVVLTIVFLSLTLMINTFLEALIMMTFLLIIIRLYYSLKVPCLATLY